MKTAPEASANRFIASDPVTGWRGRPGFAGVATAFPHVPIRLNAEGWRELPPPPASASVALDLYGCSYVFGDGVLVEHTFAAFLQRSMSDVLIRAIGVPGYATVHSFLHFQRRLRSANPPEVAVFCLLDVHLKRNVASSDYVFNLQRGDWVQPSQPLTVLRAGLDLNGDLTIRRLPLDRPRLSRDDARAFAADESYCLEVTWRLIEEAHRESVRGRTVLAIAVLRRDRSPAAIDSLLARCDRLGLPTIDVSFDRGGDLDLSPSDAHPNPEGHQEYAGRLLRFLDPLVRSMPRGHQT